ncbi:hypothetical protein F2P81_008413 [Scophthalmus maximus]|uniref:Uncharacterized protein n=1 Tax=Scophthalmus maximus TaxID=52904 RepID=A0A6A4T778_SCOMX|nr:hypothetical protein F2P81_008413 [Scophthalmus maximus]
MERHNSTIGLDLFNGVKLNAVKAVDGETTVQHYNRPEPQLRDVTPHRPTKPSVAQGHESLPETFSLACLRQLMYYCPTTLEEVSDLGKMPL